MKQNTINLRRELHKYPELSNDEHHTSEQIINFIKEYNPDEIIRLGDTGVLFVFNGKDSIRMTGQRDFHIDVFFTKKEFFLTNYFSGVHSKLLNLFLSKLILI